MVENLTKNHERRITLSKHESVNRTAVNGCNGEKISAFLVKQQDQLTAYFANYYLTRPNKPLYDFLKPFVKQCKSYQEYYSKVLN